MRLILSYYILIVPIICFILFKRRENYTQITNKTVTLYHTSWCGYCKNFMPKWNELKDYIANNHDHIETKEILCEGDNQHLCNENNIEGFPTVQITDGGNSELIAGPSSAQQIIDKL